MEDRRVRFRSGRVVVGGSFPPVVDVPSGHERGPGKSQGPTHGQGVGLGLYLLTVGQGAPGQQSHGGSPLDFYAQTVLADAPLAYWRLGELSGTIVHDSSSTGTFVGTYVNGPTLGQTGIPGASDNAAVLFGSGSQTYATFGDVLPLTGTKLTIECWWKYAGVAMANFVPYVNRGNTTWRLQRGSLGDASVQFSVGNIAGSGVSATVANITDGNYHHLVGVYDQTSIILYVDAVVVASKAWNTDVPSAPGKTVGVAFNSDGSSATHATMDEVAIYNTALSAARVLAHYNAGIA